jgi:hypothetical protein
MQRSSFVSSRVWVAWESSDGHFSVRECAVVRTQLVDRYVCTVARTLEYGHYVVY